MYVCMYVCVCVCVYLYRYCSVCVYLSTVEGHVKLHVQDCTVRANPLFVHACLFCNVGNSIHPRHRTHHKHCIPKYHQNHRPSIRMLL